MAGTVWNVLAVDDKPKFLEDVEGVLTNGKHFGDDSFKVDKKGSFDEGKQALAAGRYDLIVLDVHEDGDADPGAAAVAGRDDQAGERVLTELKSIRFVPVIFYTGYPHKVRHLESPVIRVVEKGAKIEVLRDAAASILKTKLPHLSRHLEALQRDFMWEALDKEWGKMAKETSPDDLVYLMARRLANGLSRDAIQSSLGLAAVTINPVEMYIYPPLNPTLSPGDIIEAADHGLWMILTPACDFEQKKVDYPLLVRMVPFAKTKEYQNWVAQLAKGSGADAGDLAKAKGAVKTAIKSQTAERYKYVPGTYFLPDSVADFQQTKQVPLAEIDPKTRVCSLDSPFREEMLHLFSRYYGRIGTPNLDVNKHITKLEQAAAKPRK